jgi:acetyl-CoA carboxylase biotin carboxylase subunit
MLKRVLVANRGEIAVRVIRECLDSAVGTVAVYSSEDKDALHVAMADQAVCIGGPRPAASYNNMSNIIEAAVNTGCDAIHPGFGFLSENSSFAELCRENGIKFIGPSADVIEKMGNKAAARKLMRSAGVPVVPGSEGAVNGPEEAAAIADEIGYPVLLKASAGGGGRGMRRANDREGVFAAYSEAFAEAESCFGDGQLYVEKLISDPKHIEIQILADSFGNVIHLGERNCSIQRRNQKMVEEAPDWSISPALREEMGRVAVKAAQAAGYENAGTVEFVMDKAGNYYFIEMNTRLQVEHPVTEMITGINIVGEQLRIASGLPLSRRQGDVRFKGHAIECRITAENVFRDFAPEPGRVTFVHFPAGNGVRVDSGLYTGCTISPYYDSMAAKIITYGDTRLEAIRRMRRALEETVIEGVSTTVSLQNLIMYNRDFLRGDYDTGFMAANLETMLNICEAAGGKDGSPKKE